MQKPEIAFVEIVASQNRFCKSTLVRGKGVYTIFGA